MNDLEWNSYIIIFFTERSRSPKRKRSRSVSATVSACYRNIIIILNSYETGRENGKKREDQGELTSCAYKYSNLERD